MKKSPHLHILNGDGTAGAFAESGLPGDRLTWREALVEGPVHLDADTDGFLEMRAQYLDDTPGRYKEIFVPEFEKLALADDYNEITLWFEYDLFCQINLLFLLHWFKKHPTSARLSLVCPGSHPEVVPFYGLGQLTPHQLADLFPNRGAISDEMLSIGHDIWQVFAGQDPRDLQPYIDTSVPGLPHLPAALQAHMKRFPATGHGLNAIEQQILQTLTQRPQQPADLFRSFVQSMPQYGFGDRQFFAQLKALTPHWVQVREGVVRLTPAGDQLARGLGNRINHGFRDHWLGGCHLERNSIPFRWDADAAKIVTG